MILCVGTSGSGKSVLLRHLQHKDELVNSTTALNGVQASASAPPTAKTMTNGATAATTTLVNTPTFPTVGTNLVTLTKQRVKKNQTLAPDQVIVREVGGSMAPLWHTFVEPGKTKAILYVVDASSPETVGAATIYLIELLHNPCLEAAQVMVIFTKTDLKSVRNLNEIMSIMRLDQISATSKQTVQHVAFNSAKPEATLQGIYDWCLKFSSPAPKSQLQGGGQGTGGQK